MNTGAIRTWCAVEIIDDLLTALRLAWAAAHSIHLSGYQRFSQAAAAGIAAAAAIVIGKHLCHFLDTLIDFDLQIFICNAKSQSEDCAKHDHHNNCRYHPIFLSTGDDPDCSYSCD